MCTLCSVGVYVGVEKACDPLLLCMSGWKRPAILSCCIRPAIPSCCVCKEVQIVWRFQYTEQERSYCLFEVEGGTPLSHPLICGVGAKGEGKFECVMGSLNVAVFIPDATDIV